MQGSVNQWLTVRSHAQSSPGPLFSLSVEVMIDLFYMIEH